MDIRKFHGSLWVIWHTLLRMLGGKKIKNFFYIHTAKCTKLSDAPTDGYNSLLTLHLSLAPFREYVKLPSLNQESTLPCTTQSHFWASRYCDQQKTPK